MPRGVVVQIPPGGACRAGKVASHARARVQYATMQVRRYQVYRVILTDIKSWRPWTGECMIPTVLLFRICQFA